MKFFREALPSMSRMYENSQEDAVFKALGKTIYQEKRGPTMLCYQTDKETCPIKGDILFGFNLKRFMGPRGDFRWPPCG